MIAEELSVRLGDVVVATLVRFDDDRILLAFDRAYIDAGDRPTLGLAFNDEHGGIVTDQRPTRRRAPAYFANLLPEGHLRRYIAARAAVNETRDFPLLRLLGGDLPGAVVLVSEREPAGDPTETEDQSPDDAPLRFSLAGVQLKFSALAEAAGGLTVPAHGQGGDWIVKLPSMAYRGVPENEFAIMGLARAVGIDTPDVELVPVRAIQGLPPDALPGELTGANALAVRRFDRTAAGRVHTEDFAQVFNQYPERKYERVSYANVGAVLAAFSNQDAVDQFARRLAFSALVGNADMHLKNWSLIYRDGRTPELAPAYDLLSTTAYLADDRMALTLGRTKRWDQLAIEDFRRLAGAMAVPATAMVEPALETVERFRTVWPDHARRRGISEGVSAAVERQARTVPLIGHAPAPA